MLKVKINNADNFTAVELVKLKEAARLLEKAVNSKAFQDYVLACNFANNAGLTNLQIYNLIMSGKETLSTEADNEMDIDINMYYSLKNVIGYTYPNTLKTWINRRYFNNMTTAQIAGNIAHEYMHKLGFDHDFYNTLQRQYSVPYTVGNIISQFISLSDKQHPQPTCTQWQRVWYAPWKKKCVEWN